MRTVKDVLTAGNGIDNNNTNSVQVDRSIPLMSGILFLAREPSDYGRGTVLVQISSVMIAICHHHVSV